MEFNIPANKNKKLAQVLENIKKCQRLETALHMSNVTAIDRLGYNDHGPVHIKITANMALLMLRILEKRSVVPNLVKNYNLTQDDAEVVVVMGAVLHDIGQTIHRLSHETMGLVVALPIIEEVLDGVYKMPELEIIKWEIAHCIVSHEPNVVPLTIEAGITKVADALDMEKGRARVPFQAGSITIHSVSAMAIEEVMVLEGQTRPLRVVIKMSNPAGIFQVDELLRDKIETSGIKEFISVEALLDNEGKEEVMKKYNFGNGVMYGDAAEKR